MRSGGTGERVAYEPSAGRAAARFMLVVGSGPAGSGATPNPGQDPQRVGVERRSWRLVLSARPPTTC